MTKLSAQEKKDLLDEAESELRKADFRQLESPADTLSPMDFLRFLTWASSFVQESAKDRSHPVESNMIM